MDLFTNVDNEVKKKVVLSWSKMGEGDRMHFINQVSLALSIWGSDEPGKKLVVGIMERMVNDGSQSLCDFGLYIDPSLDGIGDKASKVKRASLIIEGYRLKNALPSVPHKDLNA